MHWKCKNWKGFCANSGSKSARMAKLQIFLQGHPKPAFSEKVKRGDQGKLFKNRPRSSPRLKSPKALWRKWHYPLISMHLNCKDWKTFWRKQHLQKCPNGQVMAIFATSPKGRIFWKSANGGPREIFQNSPKKMPSLKSPKSKLAQMAFSSIKYALKVQRLHKILAHKTAPKVPEWPSYGNYRQVTQTRIFWKSAKGGPRETFQKAPKT